VKKLNTRAWLALAVLVVEMGLLLFVAAGTVHYWQAWVYVSIFTGASVLTTLYLMRKDPALLERRSDSASTPTTRENFKSVSQNLRRWMPTNRAGLKKA
jgi:bacteriorhodopsin